MTEKYSELSTMPSFVQRVLSIGAVRELEHAVGRKDGGNTKAKKLIELLHSLDYEHHEDSSDEKYDLSELQTWVLKVLHAGTMYKLQLVADKDDEDPEKAKLINLLYCLKDEQYNRPISREF